MLGAYFLEVGCYRYMCLTTSNVDYLLWDGTRLLMRATFVLTDLDLMYHIKGMALHKYKILHVHVDPVLILFPRDVIHKAGHSTMSYD